jgi:hypothetical protein
MRAAWSRSANSWRPAMPRAAREALEPRAARQARTAREARKRRLGSPTSPAFGLSEPALTRLAGEAGVDVGAEAAEGPREEEPAPDDGAEAGRVAAAAGAFGAKWSSP